jgi:hypothetical protein
MGQSVLGLIARSLCDAQKSDLPIFPDDSLTDRRGFLNTYG